MVTVKAITIGATDRAKVLMVLTSLSSTGISRWAR